MSRSNDPATSRHDIRIYQGITLNTLWHWFVDDPDVVGRYSRKLGALVHKDRTGLSPRPRSRVNPSGGVTEGALRSIISSIPGSSEDQPPVLTTNDPEHGFTQLLDLAIGCWEYDCSINEKFRNFAKEVREKWQMHCAEEFSQRTSRIPHQRSIDWMFVALVFEWQDIFQTKSARVVIKFDPRDRMDLEKYKYLPDDFREIVTEMRREIVLKTYNQIRDSWMSLYDPENRNGLSMGIIHSHFNEPQFDLDLRKPAPEDLHEQIDADNLLREFETILGGTADEQVEPQPQPQSRERREVEAVRRDARRHGRGGGFGLAARNTFKSTLEASKKALRTNLNGTTGSMSSDHTSEHIESWRETQSNLEAKTNNWRTNNLSVVPFANSRFSELRNRHIQQPASELDTNGRTP